MKYWTFLTNQSPKWLLYAIESYIIYILAILFYPIIFDTSFNIPVYLLWITFLLLRIPFMISKENKKKIFYLFVALLVIIGKILGLEIIQSIIILIVLIWRFSRIENSIDIIIESYLNRFLLYVLFGSLFFVLNSLNDYQITNIWVIKSYIIVFIFYLLGGLSLQMRESVFDKEMRKSLFTQAAIIIIGISLLVATFYIFQSYIYLFFKLIKKGLDYFLLFIGTQVQRFYEYLLSGKDTSKISILNGSSTNENDQLNDIWENYEYNIKFWDTFEQIVYFLIILGIVIIFLRLVKRIKIESPLIRDNEIKLSKGKIASMHSRRKRFISPNPYRKFYQQYLLWVLKNKSIRLEESDTTNEINLKLLNKYPSINTSLESVTNIYQRIRYGKSEPNISSQEFKNIIKKIKEQMK